MLQEQDLQAIARLIDERAAQTEKRVGQRLDGIDARLDGVDARLDGMDKRFDGIDARFDGIDARLDGIDVRLDGMDKRFDKLEADLAEVSDDLFKEIGITQVYLEKKIDRNSEQIVALTNLCRINQVENERLLLECKHISKRLDGLEKKCRNTGFMNV